MRILTREEAKVGRGRGSVTRQASQNRYYMKHTKWFEISRKINYRKQKVKQFQKEIKELKEQLRKEEAKKNV